MTRSVAIALVCLTLCAGNAAADAITDWNKTVVNATVAAGRPNPETSAAATYVHLAIYDAIVSIAGRYTPYATHVANAPAGASREAAAAEAAYTILVVLYPSATF